MIKACMPYYYGNLHKRAIESCEKAAKAGILYWNPDECMLLGTQIHMARNLLIAQNTLIRPEIDKRFTHFLNLDSDVAFEPEHIEMLRDTKKPIISGVYRKEQGIVAGSIDENGLGWMQETNDIGEVEWTGEGFSLKEREVFEMISAPWYENYFQYDVDTYQAFGEDVSFCKKARAYGYKIYLHGECEVEHLPKKITIQ